MYAQSPCELAFPLGRSKIQLIVHFINTTAFSSGIKRAPSPFLCTAIMSGADWKGRFSDKQLERKRLSDKISQRRLRQQSKRSVAELECHLRLLADGDTATLINQMQQQNALLRTKIWRYRYQMESFFLKGKECLLEDDSSWSDINVAILTHPPSQQSQNLLQSEGASHATLQMNHEMWLNQLAEQKCLKMLIEKAPSLFRELGSFLGCTSSSQSNLATNEILESIMMWKAKFTLESNDEFAVLLASQGLGAEPYNLTLGRSTDKFDTLSLPCKLTIFPTPCSRSQGAGSVQVCLS